MKRESQRTHTEELGRAQELADLAHGPTFEEEAANADPKKREALLQTVTIAEDIKRAGGRAVVVGGFARDVAMRRLGYDLEPKDIDLEVHGIDFEKLSALLSNHGEINVVGKQFVVIKLGELDVSIPRRDSKIGKGHKGFAVSGDPSMTLEEAARRRDFTINALALNPLTGEIIDPYGGLDDMQHKVLRAVDVKTFAEDPLRVLRAMQFAGRFGFTVDDKTVALCRTIDLSELPRERVGDEWQKLLLKSEKPRIGLEEARRLGVLAKLHPELAALKGLEQDPAYHPEGDVWEHTKLAVDAAVAIARKEKLSNDDALVIILGTLCHDLGKAKTMEQKPDGGITYYGHPEAGVPLAEKFLESINMPQRIVARVLPLVREHLVPIMSQELSDSGLRRLAKRLHPATLTELMWVSKADSAKGGSLDRDELLSRAEKLDVAREQPRPIIMGRDLLELGFTQGVVLGQALKKINDAYLDGLIKTREEALAMAHELLQKGRTAAE